MTSPYRGYQADTLVWAGAYPSTYPRTAEGIIATLTWLAEHNISVINPHYPDQASLSIGEAVKAMVSPPIVMTSFHGADVSQILNKEKASHALWQEFIQVNKTLIACSCAFAETVSSAFGEPARDRVKVVHNGFAIPGEIESRLPKKNSVPVILNVAKYESKKGQDLLLRAFAYLLDDHPDAKLIFAGARGDALVALQGLSKMLEVDKHVTFLQELPHQEVVKLYQEASLFCLPSREEPFGIVVLEAGAFGLPVVASAVGGVKEIIANGVNGVLVPPQDPWSLKEAISWLLRDEKQAESMAQALREHVYQNFSWEISYQKYIQAIQ